MKRALFLIIVLLALPSFAWAGDFALSGYVEAGGRSTAEDYEEEDTDDEYRYQNEHLKLGHKVSNRLSYYISSFLYDKDYKSRDSLDNRTRLFKTKWSYYLRPPKADAVRLDIRLNYKERRFGNSPGSEYDQLRAAPTVIFKKKDVYRVDLTAGIDDYDYLAQGRKDQLKIFGKAGLDRYFLEKRLLFTSSYRLEQLEQKKIGRERTRHEVRGGFDYIFGLPLIYKIAARADWGERDTKENEERDDDLDYEYRRYYTKTEHRITHRAKTELRYQYFKKDYISADLDHSGFYIRNGWDYEVLNDAGQRAGLDAAFEHKDAGYTLKGGNDYQKETVELGANYQRKKDWKASVGLEGNFYDFDASGSDKKRYYAKVSGEKLFLNGDLILSLDLKYKYTDYAQSDDRREEAVRAAFRYNF